MRIVSAARPRFNPAPDRDDRCGMENARVLMFVPPGRQARFYMEGIFIGARRLGLGCDRVELAELWRRLPPGRSSDAMIRRAADWMRGLIARRGITHALGYADSAAFDLGFTEHAGRPRTFWSDEGVLSMHLWTDHPNWSAGGASLRDPARELLADPAHVHFLKSRAAADEASEVLGWPRVHALPMAEEPGLEGFPSDPAPLAGEGGGGPRFDAVAIVGALRAVPEWLTPLLGDDAVTHADLVRANADAALCAWDTWTAASEAAPHLDLRGLGRAWIESKTAAPLAALHDLAGPLRHGFARELDWLAADARRWYGSLRALQVLTDGVRQFWLAWLGRRARLGVFGADASPIGVEQSPRQRLWVPYARQSAVYRLGASAININQAHDERGVTHKPFQIAASGVPLVHAETGGLDELFDTNPGPRQEAAAFRSGPDLLEAVRALADDPDLRRRRAEAAHRRLLAEHRWEHRLPRMLAAAAPDRSPTEASLAA